MGNNKNYSNKSFKYIVTGASIMAAAALITAVIFGRFMKMVNTLENDDNESFDKHYIFVVGDNEAEFWEQVYEAAFAQAKEDGIYLENIRESLNVNLSNEELLRIAVNSSADGIIYAGNSTESIEKLINRAVSNGIGVVVLHNDIEHSDRQCFVGVNNYELGQLDASQILKMTSKTGLPNSNIAILVSKDMSEGAANLIVLAIEDTLLEVMDEESLPNIETIRIDAEDTFSVEEDIRNIFVSEDELPDIVVCLEGSYTQCVYQAVVDYNHVGEVKILGYFANKDILEGIDKEIIFSTISIDTEEMGKSAILAIEEYNEMGYTNSFLPVEMKVIDKTAAEKMLQSMNENDKEN